MSFENLSDTTRAAVVSELLKEQKILLENPAVKSYLETAELIRRLEKSNGQLQIPFSDREEKPKLKKNGSARIVRYKDIQKNILSVMSGLNATEPGRWDYLETITEMVAELYQVSGRKTIAHLKTCVQAFLNKKGNGVEFAQDENKKRIYRLAPSK